MAVSCGHDHGELNKGPKREPRRLPHRAPQAWIDATGAFYAAAMQKMLDEVAEVLTGSPMAKAEQLYIGPRGGRWANPEHTESYRQLGLDFSGTRAHYFASGSNHEGEIRGFHESGINVGVAAHETNTAAENALKELRGTGTKVFVDSGAFSEIGFNYPAKKADPKRGIKAGDLPRPDLPIGPFVKEPISDDEWQHRLDLYSRLAEHLGHQLYAVAPDKVAFQDDTFERLSKYATRIRALHAQGANILVPLQKGKLSLADFDRKVEALLGFDYVRAIPMKKDATTTADLKAFLAERHPARLHLLGLGPESDRYDEVMRAIKETSPETEVFLDSVKITSAVENAKPKKSGGWSPPRKLTAATRRKEAQLDADVFARDAYSDNIGNPSSWLTGPARVAVAKAAKLTVDEAKRFKKDPTAFVSERDEDGVTRRHAPLLSEALDHAWRDFYLSDFAIAEKKRDAIKDVWSGGPAPIHLLTRDEHLARTPVVAPAHRSDVQRYTWEALMDAEGAHREAVHHALVEHVMSPEDYAAQHEKDYGPIQSFLKDPGTGTWAAGEPPG